MNQLRQKCVIFFALLFFSICTASLETKGSGQAFLIKGARIYTSGSRGILEGPSLLVEDGKIKKIFKGEEPPQVSAVDYSGKCIMPGLVDGHTYLSGYYRLLENTQPITSDLIAYVAFNPFNPEVQEAQKSGITTVHLAPRSENLVGGVSSIFKLKGNLADFLFLKKEAFLKISFNAEVTREDRAPTSLMGASAILSERLQSIKENHSGKREGIFEQKGLRKLLEGTLQPIIAASTYEEINIALKWLNDWNKQGVILGGEEAHLHCQELKRRGIPVLLSPLLFSSPEEMAKNAASLLKNGVKIAFVSDMPEGDAWGLRLSALFLFHQGLTQEEALKTITLFPAQILGIEDSVGSLEEGKDADFIVSSGEPLDLSSEIIAVYSGGEIVYRKK